MGKYLKTVSILLALTLILPLYSFGQNSPASSTQSSKYKGIPDNEVSEIQEAIAVGLVPKGMSVQGNITAKELLTLLSNCINMRKGNTKVLTANTKNTSAKTVWRQDAALALYYAANAMKVYKPNTDSYPDPTDSISGIKWASNLFTNWEGNIPVPDGGKTDKYPKIFYAAVFVLQHKSVHSGEALMSPDKSNRFNYTAYMTRKDAILAAYRLYGSFEDKPVYSALTAAGAVTNTIPKELLSKKSTLPEVSNKKIPAYKGYYIQNKESAIWSPGFVINRHFQESEVRFLADNGFNFINVHLGFTTLSYPDFPDAKVNLNELKDLDRLIGWGIKYNVHVCIAMNGLPGVSSKSIKDMLSTNDPASLFTEAHDKYEDASLVFGSADKQKLVLQYWTMLAKRYANVPTKYLSFLLITEPNVASDAEYTKVFGPVADAIWKENPDRVVFSYAYSNDVALEGLAQKGCAMAWSSYYPSIFNYYGADGLSEINSRYPYLKQPPQWPMLYLPATLDGGRENDNTLRLHGNFSEGTIGIYADKKYMDPSGNVITINADNRAILSEEVKGKDPQEYIGSIPKGTKEISIKVNEGGWLQYGRLEIKQRGKKNIDLYPHDLFIADNNAVMPELNVADNGTVTTADKNMAVDFDYIYDMNIRKNAELAEKYNVGFMLLEWGPFGTISDDSRYKYEGMMLAGFSKLGIGWCHQSLLRQDSILLTKNDFYSNFKGNTANGKYAQLQSDGRYYVNTKLLALYRQYTKK